MSAKYLAGVRFAANQDKLVTKLHHGVVLDGQVVGLVVAAALIRQIARTHRPMKFRSLEVGAYVKKRKKVILANCKKNNSNKKPRHFYTLSCHLFICYNFRCSHRQLNTERDYYAWFLISCTPSLRTVASEAICKREAPAEKFLTCPSLFSCAPHMRGHNDCLLPTERQFEVVKSGQWQ